MHREQDAGWVLHGRGEARPQEVRGRGHQGLGGALAEAGCRPGSSQAGPGAAVSPGKLPTGSLGSTSGLLMHSLSASAWLAVSSARAARCVSAEKARAPFTGLQHQAPDCSWSVPWFPM